MYRKLLPSAPIQWVPGTHKRAFTPLPTPTRPGRNVPLKPEEIFPKQTCDPEPSLIPLKSRSLSQRRNEIQNNSSLFFKHLRPCEMRSVQVNLSAAAELMRERVSFTAGGGRTKRKINKGNKIPRHEDEAEINELRVETRGQKAKDDKKERNDKIEDKKETRGDQE